MPNMQQAQVRSIPMLDDLNQAELDALALLAEGHTAKSIAAATGRSVAAINERLREARRKTGIGSSRELARIIRAQKNADEKIDLVSPAEDEARPAPSAAPRWRWRYRTGVVTMGLLLVGGMAAAIALQQGAATAEKVAPDPQLYRLLPPTTFDPEQLHRQLQGQPRDARWADAAEKILQDRYRAIAHVNDAGRLHVACAASLCEVSNTLPTAGSINEAASDSLYADLQSRRLVADLRVAKLDHSGSVFTDAKGKPSVPVFLAFWTRPTPRNTSDDPRLAGILTRTESGMRLRYAQLRQEKRDPAWADATERQLHRLYAQVQGVGETNSPVRISCATTLCEVRATTPLHAPRAVVDAWYKNLQSWRLTNGINQMGLREEGPMFTGSGLGDRSIYVDYLLRTG